MILFNRRFAPGWRMTTLALLTMVFFIALGVWQLQRAEEKKEILTARTHLASQSPILWEPGMPKPKQYQSIVVQGKLLPTTLLLDNQHYQHQFGYHVLTPMQLNDKAVVIIDRGWVRADISRQQLPEFVNATKSLQVSGEAYYPSDKHWVLGQSLEKKGVNIAIIELVDTQIISQFLHKSVYPFIIHLDKAAADGFVREWPPVSILPERHNAYALQWFAMALVMLIIFVGLNAKKIDENNKT